MKVRATRLGYYNHVRRYEGDVFSIPDTPRRKLTDREKQRSELMAVMDKDGTVPAVFGTWMQRVDDRARESITSAQDALNKTSQEIKAGRQAARGGGEQTESATGSAEVI